MLNFLKRRKESGNWRGVYSRFGDVPRSGPAFGGEVWRDVLTAQLRDVDGGQWSEVVVVEHEVLLLLARLLSGEALHVVDFGGGFGASHAYLRKAMPDVRLRYDIVEVPEVVAAAPSRDGVSFADRLEPRHHDAAIVFVKSVLQYAEDYRAAIRSLMSLNARFVLLEKFSGVDCASYASAQVTVTGSSIPYWFISFGEVLDIAREAGYAPLLRRRLPRTYDQSAFPAELRMNQASTLLFAR